jgi:hypothetical protein
VIDAILAAIFIYAQAYVRKQKWYLIVVTLQPSYSCGPRVRHKFREALRVWYLVPHYCAAVLLDRAITTKQIIANKRERYNNSISYSAAFKVRVSLREEKKMVSDERQVYISIYLRQTSWFHQVYDMKKTK